MSTKKSLFLGVSSILLGVCITVTIVTAPGWASTVPLPDGPYNYKIINQDLPTALQEFGSNNKLKVVVSPEVKGQIQGQLPEGTARAFLDALAAEYNLEWYYDDAVLYITSATENRTQLLVLNPVPYGRFKAALASLDIADSRYAIRTTAGKGVALVTGPPRYVTLVEQTLAGLVAEERASQQSGAKEIEAKDVDGKVVDAKHETSSKSLDEAAFTVFRGSQVTIIHDGRPERLIGPEAEPTQQTANAANEGAPGYPPPGAQGKAAR